MKNKIIVVTHKNYEMPRDSIYLPIVVGGGIAELSDKFQPDNTGENISKTNDTYCELTAIYWAWKNLPLSEIDYIGIAHYRRHFSLKADHAISGSELEQAIKETDLNFIIATPHRRYIGSVEQHYIHSRKGYEEIHRKDIERLKKAIHICSPSCDVFANKVLQGNSAHMLNMFIMSSLNFQLYCSWLFPIIDTVVELSRDRDDQRRYAGAISEFCLDIWALGNDIGIRELKLFETEKSSPLKKVANYIKRRL